VKNGHRLLKYDAARQALAEAHRVDEVKSIRDKAAGLAEYARQAKDRDMVTWATEIRVRAERRAGQLLEGTEKSKGGNPNLSSGKDRLPTLKSLGITRNQSSSWQKLAAIPEAEFEERVRDLAEEVTHTSGRMILRERAREVAAAEREAALASAAAELDGLKVWERAEVRRCSMQDLLESLLNVDAIITDPPYGEEWIPLYGELARLAKVALKPEGVLAVMTGQYHLLDVGALMARHLQYRWTLAYMTPGGQSPQIWPRKVNTFWKPVILFGAAERWIGDVVRSDVNDNDKRFHEWGQSESGMARLVEILTEPGQLVCDPFLGGGTTAIAALALRRRFIGADVDAEHVETAKRRIASVKV